MLFRPVIALGFTLAAALQAPGAERAPAPPNVVLIMVDDMGFSDLACYGSDIATPHLDQLAADGLRFTQFYNTGRCWPTRAALLTGKYPHAVGHAMMFGGDAPPAYRGTSKERALMIPELLKTVGYRSYHVGKWHLNDRNPQPNRTWPLGRGFDRSYFVKTQNNYFNPRQIYDETQLLERPGKDGDYYSTEVLSDRAVRYLNEHSARPAAEPFFLYLAYTAPHFPLHALPEDIAKFRGKFLHGWDEERKQRFERQRRMGLIDCSLSPPDPDAAAWESLTEEDKRIWEGRMAVHAAMIHCVDRGVGRVVETLKRTGAFENTLILFLSDNGASAEYLVRGDGHDPLAPLGSGATYRCLEVGWANAANTPFRYHKIWVHEGGIATPLIAHWPRGITRAGEWERAPGHVIDILPTIVELAGVPSPDEAPGISLVPSFQGAPRKPHSLLFWEHVGNRALRRGDWKLVAVNQGPWELYNLAIDRSETRNLATEQTDKVAELSRLWNEYARQIGVVEWNTLPQSRSTPGPDYRQK